MGACADSPLSISNSNAAGDSHLGILRGAAPLPLPVRSGRGGGCGNSKDRVCTLSDSGTTLSSPLGFPGARGIPSQSGCAQVSATGSARYMHNSDINIELCGSVGIVAGRPVGMARGGAFLFGKKRPVTKY